MAIIILALAAEAATTENSLHFGRYPVVFGPDSGSVGLDNFCLRLCLSVRALTQPFEKKLVP